MNLYATYISDYLNSQSVKTNVDGQVINGTQINLVPHLNPDTCRLTTKALQERALLLPYQKFENMDDVAMHKAATMLANKIAANKPDVNKTELEAKCYNFVSSMRDYARVHDPKLAGAKAPSPSPAAPAKNSKTALLWSGIGAAILIGLIVLFIVQARKSKW